jgi:hypothetical protein
MGKWVIKDSDGNILNTFTGKAKDRYVGTDWNGTTVASVEQLTIAEDLREKRKKVFSTTIDLMNPVWYNSLSADQKYRLATWRQEWLDYPSTETDPTTDVSDIFP